LSLKLLSRFPSIAFALPLALAACGSDQPDTLSDVLIDLESDYTRLIQQHTPPVLCPYINPATSAQSCGELVDVIESSNLALHIALVRLGDVAARSRSEERMLVDGAIAALSAADKADHLIVDGWRNMDGATYAQGWERHDEAAEMWAQFVEDLQRFVQDRSPTP
jgi:hypothetical protein